MTDWLKPYLVQKSIEAVQKLGIGDKKDEVIAEDSKGLEIERRKCERVSVRFPVVYEIGKETLTGSAVNASDEGMMAESLLSSERALDILEVLITKRDYRLEINCIHEGKTYRQDAEIKHLHLHSSDEGPCRFTVGFRIANFEKIKASMGR